MSYCPRCGLQVENHMAFCPRCGLALQYGGQYNGQQPYPLMQQQLGWGQPTPQTIEDKRMAQAYPDRKYPQLMQMVDSEKRMDGGWKERETRKEDAKGKDPDPTFSKFVDAPRKPLPFFVGKIAMGLSSILCAGYLLYQCYKLETFMWLMTNAKENIPGIPLLAFAVFALVAAMPCFLSKYDRTIAGVGGALYFLVAGFGFVYHGEYTMLLPLSAVAVVYALVMLISSAGGIHVSLDE